jgi:hypothetical protein
MMPGAGKLLKEPKGITRFRDCGEFKNHLMEQYCYDTQARLKCIWSVFLAVGLA